MSPMLIKFISVAIMNIVAIIIIKKITKYKNKLLSLKTLFWFAISMLPTAIFYTSEYDFTTFLTFLILILSLKNIFDIDILTSCILTLYVMAFSAISDLIVSTVIVNFMSLPEIRETFYIMFISNAIVSLLTYIAFCIPAVQRLVNKSIEKIHKPKNRRVLTFCLFAYIAIVISFYVASKVFIPTQDYFIINLVILTFIAMIFIYMNEILKYDKLLTQNNILFECMQNIEDYQEQQDLKIHEYKNQLSKIMAVTKDKKVIKVLNKILKVDLSNDNYILGQIKYIPKGEIKSLIYYKLLVAHKEGLNILVDISPKLVNEDFALSTSQNNELSQLIGIYFDNAIEASASSTKKQLTLEIYKIKKNIFFVITNTYKGKIKLNHVIKKGFSTKGNGRGKGLYFASKIVSNSSYFISDAKIIGEYFIQKLELKKE